MWRNSGRKIQLAGFVALLLGTVASVVGAIELWSRNSAYYSTIMLGFAVLIGGILLSLLLSLLLHGFGVIVEKAEYERARIAPDGNAGLDLRALFSGRKAAPSKNGAGKGGNACPNNGAGNGETPILATGGTPIRTAEPGTAAPIRAREPAMA